MKIPKSIKSFGNNTLKFAAYAASAGGEVVKAGYGKMHKIREKGVGDLVSGIDTASEKRILAIIRTQYRGPIMCEESGPDNNGEWIVDPLDGTAAFLFNAGGDKPSILIAHQIDRVTDVAVVFLPLTDEWFYAVKGMGAFRGDGTKLSVKGCTRTLRKAWVEMNQYGDSEYESTFFAKLRVKLRGKKGARLVTSQVPHSAISMRMFDGSTRLSAVVHDNNQRKVKQAPWDVAAPKLIVEEAGGVVLNSWGEPYDIFRPDPIIMATSRMLANQIVLLAV